MGVCQVILSTFLWVAKGQDKQKRVTPAKQSKTNHMISRMISRIVSPTPIKDILHAAQLFYTTEDRSANDANNKIRENFLATVLDTDHPDTHFNTIKTKWQQFLSSLADGSPQLRQTAGRGNHHDFVAYYPSPTHPVTIPIEFKHNAKSIREIPQFLSLPTKKAVFMPVEYAGYFYDAYLPKFVDADPVLSAHQIPDRQTYLRKVFSCNYEGHPFFRMAKSRDTPEGNKAVKDQIVNASITDYLTAFGPNTDKEKLTILFQNTQDGKVYALWDPATETFYKDSLTPTDLTITSVGDIKNGNTLIAKSATKEFHMLLRWKNHKGVLYPAWQIKCIPLVSVPSHPTSI